MWPLMMLQEEGLAERKGVQMRILGDLDLAPASVRGAAARLMQASAAIRNKQAVLNICFAYTWVPGLWCARTKGLVHPCHPHRAGV